jgi:hypothetical protein
MYKQFHQRLSSLASVYNILNLLELTTEWSEIYVSRKKYRGKQDSIKFCKELNTCAERYVLHMPIEPIPFTKSDTDNFPKILTKFKPWLRSKDPKRVVFALSVLRTVEDLRLPISKDIATVTDPPLDRDNKLLKDICSFIPKWTKRISPLSLPEMNYHMTVKNGPNGQALSTSDSDISAVINTPSIYEAIRNIERILTDKRPMEDINPVKDNTYHSKLIQFPEKAGKTRTIAILDYYSQRCLKPVHTGIMNILKTLVSDGTYSHSNVGKYAQQKTKEKSYIYCCDLTAATDRFPKEIQQQLLHALIKDKDLATSVWTLLSERTFKVAWSDEYVTYNCGQPMGAYSSWPLFALAHHLVVEYCAYKTRRFYDVKRTKVHLTYKLIGDDVIITDKRTARYYANVMESLGLTINKGKTVESFPSSEFSGAEVAKQLYLNGICLTPLTPGFIKDCGNPYMFNTCMETMKSRYGFFDCTKVPELIDAFFPKKKTHKLTWLLSSDPMSGIIKPEISGYNELSPWSQVDPDNAGRTYQKVGVLSLTKKAGEIQMLVFNNGLPSGSHQDGTTSDPQAQIYARDDAYEYLNALLSEMRIMAFQPQVYYQQVLDLVTYIPDPYLPFMRRSELRARLQGSLKERTLSKIVNAR